MPRVTDARCTCSLVVRRVLSDQQHGRHIAEANLDVAVRDAQTVAIVHSHHELLEQPPHQRLVHAAALHERCERGFMPHRQTEARATQTLFHDASCNVGSVTSDIGWPYSKAVRHPADELWVWLCLAIGRANTVGYTLIRSSPQGRTGRQ